MEIHPNTPTAPPAPRHHTGRGRQATVWLAAVLTAAFAAAPARAAQPGISEISSDPFAVDSAPTAAHATEVEPDTFAWGSTVVTAFQTGRVFNGGSSDIGWATSRNGGISWRHGFMPAATTASKPAGRFFAASDASVAFDAAHRTWMVSWLGLSQSGGGVVDVVASRSTDGGLTWSAPVTVAATGTFYDKNWTTCDNSRSSRFYGHCYTEFDDASQGDLELMSTSADAGRTWSAPSPTADSAHGLGGQPVVQPDGRVVVPFEGVGANNGIDAFTSNDGGATWNASVLISTRTAHRVPGLRTSPLPSAELNRRGTVYVVWQDNRFEAGGTANDIVLTSSADGTSWSPVTRIPLNPVGSGVDHFIPGLGVDRTTSGSHTALALTYYSETPAGCTGSTCQIQAEFSSSLDNGRTWTTPTPLGAPMQLGWLAPTNQGVMVGDYISTSFLAGEQRVVSVIAVASAPRPDGLFDQPMFGVREKVRTGSVPAAADPVRFSPSTRLEPTTTTAY
jgi:BNR repeat-like domain